SRGIRVLLRTIELKKSPDLLEGCLFGTDDIDREAALRYVRSVAGREELLRLVATLLLELPSVRAARRALRAESGEIFFVVFISTCFEGLVSTRPSSSTPIRTEISVTSGVTYEKLERALKLLPVGMTVGAQIAGRYVQCESLPTADLV